MKGQLGVTMPLVIDDDELTALAEDLAKRKRTTVDEVVRLALEREARDLDAEFEAVWRDVKDMQARVRAEWRGPITSNHDFLYDEKGDPIL